MENPRTSPEASIDTAFRAFETRRAEFKQYENQDLSESDTRSKVIDPILDILGWREQTIQREWHERTEGTFLDYKLATTQPVFVVEAKKNFVHFEIPPRWDAPLPHRRGDKEGKEPFGCNYSSAAIRAQQRHIILLRHQRVSIRVFSLN